MKNRKIITLLVCALIGGGAGISGQAQTAPATSSLSPELQQVVRLSQQHIGDDVIVNYIKTSGKTYQLSADDIISLHSQGVSQGVIGMLQTTSSPTGVPLPTPQTLPPADSSSPLPPLDTVSAAPPIAPAPTMDYFQAQLRPYGNWEEVPGYGLCWQPAVDFGWRPYYNEGHWEFTDAGWYWQSDYPWGDIAFHYGRWAYTASGWVWAPGFDYAPAWVVWRHADADGYVGWAALPPGAVFIGGVWEFNHARVGFDFDFGLGLNFFTFVGFDHFWEHDFRRFILPRDRVELVFRRSVIESRYHLDHGRFINEGLGRDRMAVLTHHEIKAVAVHDLRDREEHRNVLARNEDAHNFKPGAKPDARRLAPEHPATPEKNHNDPRGQSSPKGSPERGDRGERAESK